MIGSTSSAIGSAPANIGKHRQPIGIHPRIIANHRQAIANHLQVIAIHGQAPASGGGYMRWHSKRVPMVRDGFTMFILNPLQSIGNHHIILPILITLLQYGFTGTKEVLQSLMAQWGHPLW